MIDYVFADQQFDDLSNKLLLPAFRKIALSYCTTSSNIYDALELYNDLTGTELSAGEGRSDLLDKYRLRLTRLIQRLNIENSSNKTSNIFFAKKVYDTKLYENMVIPYLGLSKTLGDTYAQTFSLETWTRSIAIEERKGFSFVEFALIICLFLALKGRSIGKLNVPITTENELKRAKPRFKKIKKVLFSKEFEIILGSLLLDLLADYHQKNYEDSLNHHITAYWLPTNKQHLKSARYAAKRYGNKVKEYYSYTDFDALNSTRKLSLLTEHENINKIQWLFFVIVPIVEVFLNNALPSDIQQLFISESTHQTTNSTTINMRDHLLSSNIVLPDIQEHIKNTLPTTYETIAEDYLIAYKLYNSILEYISEIRKAVVSLLETLPESCIAGNIDLWHYFLKL